MIGQQVGRFRIIAKLGEGGMGSVWKAEDPLLSRTVALKLLSEEVEASTPAYRHFLREARATSSLDHPGIATLFDAGDHGGRLYIASRLVDGQTVGDLTAQGPLPLKQAVRIATEAADALEHAHVHGVIHRDVSANNIMVAHDGRIVVIDFGLALALSATPSSSSGFPAGTISYMAPEVMQDKPSDRRSDVYSLGVVFYQMVTGVLPHTGDLPAVVIYSAVHRKPARPSSLRPEVGPELERVMMRAIAKDPERRYQSAAHFAQELRAIDLDVPVRSPRRPRSSPRRRVRSADVPALPSRKCLAVAAFVPLGGAGTENTQEDALARGLAESLSSSLARVPHLRIVPPGTMEQARSGGDTTTAAKQLGANLLVTGTLSRSNDVVRIGYSVVETRRGMQVGGDRVDGSPGDLMAVEDALLTSLLRILQVATQDRVEPLAGRRGGLAHEQYLRALGHLQRTDDETAVDRAITILEELVIAEGDTAVVHAKLGLAYERKYRHTHQTDWMRKAEASCRTALALDPHAPEILISLARLHSASGRYESAYEALQTALKLRDQDPDALWELSRTCEGMGRLDEAEEAAQRLIDLYPEYWKGYDRLGMLRFRRGQYEGAATSWVRVTELTPDSSNAHKNLAAALFHTGNLEDALKEFERSVAIHPTSTSYVGLGSVRFFMGHRRESVGLFERAVALQPKDSRVWGNLADAQRWVPGLEEDSARSFDRAIELAREELKINPHDAECWARLATSLAKRGRCAEGLQAIGEALKLSPRNVNCMARGIAVHELAGQRPRAVELFVEAARAGYAWVELEGDPELEDLRRVPVVVNALEEERARMANRKRAAQG